MTRVEEREIIDKVLSGNAGAFETLVLEHQDKVYSLHLRMTGNAEDARDLSQETFLRAFSSLDGFQGRSKFSVWLYRIATNICIDFLRGRGRRPIESMTADDGVTELEIPDRRFNPETRLEQRDMTRAVNDGLARLPVDYREILLLREIGGLSYDEISKTLGLEPGTVKSRIFRARKKLCAELLRGNFYDEAASKESEEV